MIRTTTLGLGALLAAAALAGCEHSIPTDADPAGRTIALQGSKMLDLDLCAPGQGAFTLASINPWFPMDVGHHWTYEGEEDGVPVALEITVLDMTRTIDGVTTRVIEEREWEDGELLEVSWNYFVQTDPDGTVCYYGEDVDIYEDGEIVHEGAWCADDAGNAPGIFLPADPQPGMMYATESAPGIAEDEAKIVGIGPTSVPYGDFTETLRVRESNPIDGDKDYKVFASGFGLIVDGPLALTDFAPNEPNPGPPALTLQVCGT